MLFNRRDPEAPKEILNWNLWFGVFVFGLMGGEISRRENEFGEARPTTDILSQPLVA